MSYLILFLIVLVANVIPAFMPPTWTIIVFAVNYYSFDIPSVIAIAVIAATLGRMLLMIYIEWFSHKFFNHWEEENLKFLGSEIGKSDLHNLWFTIIYSITPLPTVELFLAVSLAKLRRLPFLIGFFIGRSISYTVLAYTSLLIIKDFEGLFTGKFNLSTFITFLLSFLILFLLIFLDWRELLLHHKLRLHFNIWRENKI